MVRRPKVDRLASGIPVWPERCKATVQRRGELLPDRCRRPRLRGLAWCRQHVTMRNTL